MMSQSPLKLQVVLVAVLLHLGSVFVCAADDASQCQIPEGEFDGMIYDTHVLEPYYGYFLINITSLVNLVRTMLIRIHSLISIAPLSRCK